MVTVSFDFIHSNNDKYIETLFRPKTILPLMEPKVECVELLEPAHECWVFQKENSEILQHFGYIYSLDND